MSKTKTLISLSTITSIVLLSSCSMLGKIVAEGITETTNSLKGVACTFMYVNNLYPKKTQTTSLEYFGNEWLEGDNAVIISMLKKKGIGLYKLNGDVSIDNDVIPYLANGSYIGFYEPSDLKPKKITLKTKNGDEASVSIDAPKPFNLISVNGEKENSQVDLNSDLTLEFDDFKNLEKDEKIKVSFLMDVLGVREFVDIGVFKPTKKIKIPSAAFKNLSVSASASGVAELKAGPNYIRVERFKVKKERIPTLAASQAVSMSWSTMPVQLKGSSTQNINLEVHGVLDEKAKEAMGYSFSKPNAFFGKPISKIKKLALYSLSVRGLLRNVQTSSSTSTAGNVQTTTTTTITRQFPKLPDIYWEQLLNNSYKDLEKLLKDMNIELITVDKVLKSKEYSFIEEIEEENNKVNVVKKYKNTKALMPTSLTGLLASVSSTFANDRPEVRLIDELGVDGLIGLSVDLVIDSKSDLIKLIPTASVRIIGGTNGYAVGPVTYANGQVSGEGVPFSEKEFSDINALNRITRKNDLMKSLSKGIKDLSQKEKEKGYDAIWSLQ
jgi:hypothetical protein